jgi:type IV pilus assembly protein PilM
MWTGIDIGHEYIKVVQITSEWGGLRLSGIAKVKNELPPADESKTSSTIRTFARNQLQRIFQSLLNPARCAIGVTGRDINLRIIQMPPIPSPVKFRKMMEYELIQISGKSGESLYSDYCRLNLAEKPYPEIPVLVGMAKNTFIDDEIKRMKRSGLAVEDICPNAIALSYVLRQAELIRPGETVLLADIGAVNTEIVIHQGRHLIFARNISGGGVDMTEAIHTRMGISRPESEALKLVAGKIVPRETATSGENLALQEALRSGVGQIQSAIESALAFALAQLKVEKISPDRIFLSGGAAKLKGLAGYLSESLNKPVEIFRPFKNIKTPLPRETKEKITEVDCDFSVALGLALSQAVYQSKQHISFLPPHLKRKKEIYRSSIPLIIAGVIIFVSMILWFASVYSDRAAEIHGISQLKEEQRKYTGVMDKFNQAQSLKKKTDDSYRMLKKFTRTADLSYAAIHLIAQNLPHEAWISQISMSGVSVPSVSSRDLKKPPEPDASKEITVIGYLEDDNPANLENLKGFVDRLNQPNGYLPISATLKRLDTPKNVIPRGKKEFEINLTIKDETSPANDQK